MTVLLVLLFIILALSVEAISSRKRSFATHPTSIKLRGAIQEFFEHDDMCPTMADGGQKVEEKKGETK